MKTLEQIQEENRKFIILANNPEAKSYDEALEAELDKDCVVIDILGSFSSTQAECFQHIIIHKEFGDRYLIKSEDGYDSFNTLPKENLANRDWIKIIGKPLTLSRVLIALSEDFCFYKENKTTFSIAKINQDPRSQIKWDLEKEEKETTLEDQSEETQRKFNELITNVL